MPKTRDFIPRSLAAKIIFKTVFYVAILLAPTILAMTLGMRVVIKEETGRQVDQALDGIAYRLDNVLLGVEQTAHRIHARIPNCLGSPRELQHLCLEAIEANPDITGCAIALNPDDYMVGGKPFMTYVHRSGNALVNSETFTSQPFTQQEWYTKPILQEVSSWTGPLKKENTENGPILSYDVPIMENGRAVGVLGVDVSLEALTNVAQHYKRTSHSYITLLDETGSYIVHPDSTRLIHMDSLSDLREAEDPAIMESLQAMVEGKSGKESFTMDSTAYYIAYMPFRLSAFPGRQVNNLGWSIAVIYPQKELFRQYDPGFRNSILIILAGILLLIAGAMAVSRISLKPLRKLTYISRRIANGHYLTPILETRRTDEVGRLQNLFYKMQKAISDHMENLQNLSIKEEERRKDLALTYAKTKEAEKYRSAFFSKMTHQMADVTSEIQDDIDRLNESGEIMNENELRQVLSSIEKNALKVNEILGDMLNAKNS